VERFPAIVVSLMAALARMKNSKLHNEKKE
jgi:hypothetical protein